LFTNNPWYTDEFSETIRPNEILIDDKLIQEFHETSKEFINGSLSESKQRLCDLIRNNSNNGISPNFGLDDTYEQIRQEFAKFTNDKIIPNAHNWHLNDELIPTNIINEMSDLGVFGLTIPEEYGGLGLSKTAMCIVSEELSRGWIGTGSLGTRSEIAAELILIGGNKEQKEKFLPKIAKGEILPTAVFSEPDIGSDLAHLKTRAKLNGNNYEVTGNKTWITHGARANLMTMLVRTKKEIHDHNGLSILLAEKTSGTEDNPFPDNNIKGGEIEVIGYRGMKEYDICF
jgi:Acyl-CoA dehydrogenases